MLYYSKDSIDKRLPYAVFVSLGVIGTIAAISGRYFFFNIFPAIFNLKN